jgi:hypothetical protein
MRAYLSDPEFSVEEEVLLVVRQQNICDILVGIFQSGSYST